MTLKLMNGSGTPFNSTPSDTSNSLKIRSHDLTELFAVPYIPATWHNFAVIIDWTNKTLTTFYSTNATTLSAVTGAEPNLSEASGATGRGDFHFGLLKVLCRSLFSPCVASGTEWRLLDSCLSLIQLRHLLSKRTWYISGLRRVRPRD